MSCLTPRMVRQFMFALLALVISLPAASHEIKPSIIEIVFQKDGRFVVRAEVNAEAMLADIGPGYTDTNDSPRAAEYDALRALAPDHLAARFRDGFDGVAAGFELLFDGQRVAPQLVSIEPRPTPDVQLTRVSDLRMEGPIRAPMAPSP